MKISYILQMKDFAIMFAFGAVIGVIYGILNIPNFIKQRIWTQIIADLIFSTVAFITFLLLINFINLGEIRAFLVIGYIFGFIIERITLGKLFAKGYKNVYNYIVKILQHIKKSKFGRFITK